MKFLTTKNPEAALILMPWLVPVTQSREDIYLELRERLTDNPDETFVCMIVDGDLIKGMAVAYCRYKDVFLWQARKAADLSNKMVDKAFEKIKEWARSKGFDRISAISSRPTRSYTRRWGFVESEIQGEIVLEI